MLLNILFLCTGNSCRSILSEALLNHYGKVKYKAYSAGSFPTGEVHPKSIEVLINHNISIEGLYSKSWDEFKDTKFNIVITVCNNAANEICPVFMGDFVKVHWGAPDPAHFKGTDEEIKAEFDKVFRIIQKRILALVELNVASLPKQELILKLNEIGKLL